MHVTLSFISVNSRQINDSTFEFHLAYSIRYHDVKNTYTNPLAPIELGGSGNQKRNSLGKTSLRYMVNIKTDLKRSEIDSSSKDL